MQSARFFYSFCARLKHHMVSIAEHELESNIMQHAVIKCFYGAIGSNSDKIRSVNDAMRGMYATDACSGFFRSVDEFKMEMFHILAHLRKGVMQKMVMSLMAMLKIIMSMIE